MFSKQIQPQLNQSGAMERESIAKTKLLRKIVRSRKILIKTVFFLLLSAIVLPIWSEPIDENVALKVAAQHLSHSSEMRSSTDSTLRKAPVIQKTLRLLYKSSSNNANSNAMRIKPANTTNEPVYFYVFGTENNEGFVIVAGDDRITPVLGYSGTTGFSSDNMPDNLKWWLGEYTRQIQFAIDNDIEPTPEIKQRWAQYLETETTE